MHAPDTHRPDGLAAGAGRAWGVGVSRCQHCDDVKQETRLRHAASATHAHPVSLPHPTHSRRAAVLR